MTATAPATTQVDLPNLPEDVWADWLTAFRNCVAPTTDAAMEGIFGVASMEVALSIGRAVGIQYGRPVHANLYCVLNGKTTVPRKTTVLSRGNDVMKRAFTDDFVHTTRSIGSGEGLLELFCREEEDTKTKKTVLEPVPKQRVLLDEPEFCNLLKKAKRPGTANITEILLSLYDGDNLSPRTRTKPIRVVEPFFCLITATTPENLEVNLTEVDVESGLLPRFAIFHCTPREPMAYPPPPDESTLRVLAAALQDISKHAISLGSKTPVIPLSLDARAEWEAVFKAMTAATRQQQGLVSSMLARIPAMVMKWGLIYALQAGRAEVSRQDLARASLVGTYLMETARLLPSLVQKSEPARVEDKIIRTLRSLKGQHLTSNAIHRLVSGRVKAEELRHSLDSLVKLGVIEEKTTDKDIKCYGVPAA